MKPLEQLAKELEPHRFEGTGVCIGNGPSRQGFDLWRLVNPGYVITAGCNALHRDWWPTFHVCVDREIAKEIEARQFHRMVGAVISDREREGFKVVQTGTRTKISHSAGVFAGACLMAMGCKTVFLLGHDLTGVSLYKGSKCYENDPQRS